MGSARKMQMAAAFLKLCMWGVFCWWIVVWMLSATRVWPKFDNSVTKRLTTTVYGGSASWLLLFSGPVFLIVVLASLHLQIARSKVQRLLQTNERKPRVSPWTYPVFTTGPLGIVSAAELVGLVLFLGLLVWVLSWDLVVGFESISTETLEEYNLWQIKLAYAGYYFGILGFVAMAFLFFPVSRGSVLLRLVNIPFDHAVKYHKWIGNIVMVLFSAHGLCFVIFWASEHELRREITTWNRIGVNVLAGVISLLAGILLWVTSLPQVRNRLFEVFFITHQLYIVFVVFAMMHVGEWGFSVVMAGVFLFALDRFLRFIQSRKNVGLMSMRNLGGGIMELTFAKHPNLQYSAASFVFVQIPALSWWQWHPFTMSSSSDVDSDRITILVKRQGAWTRNLENLITQAASKTTESRSCPFRLETALEGPYGHESNYFLRYKSIIFVAGGSGIAPFLSILKDLLHRHQTQQINLPTELTLIWAVKKSDELHVLDGMALPPQKESGLSLHLHAYVTREESPDLEDVDLNVKETIPYIYNSEVSPKPLCPEAALDSEWGTIAIVTSSVLGFLLVWGLIGHYYINPRIEDYPTWAQGLFNLLSMLVGIMMFGGTTAMLWSYRLGSKMHDLHPSSKQEVVKDTMGYIPETEMQSINSPPQDLHEKVFNAQNIHYGMRPNLKEIFNEAATRPVGTNVGVLVCGPTTMQQSVASQCQAHSSLMGGSVAFHFHSVSFDL